MKYINYLVIIICIDAPLHSSTFHYRAIRTFVYCIYNSRLEGSGGKRKGPQCDSAGNAQDTDFTGGRRFAYSGAVLLISNEYYQLQQHTCTKLILKYAVRWHWTYEPSVPVRQTPG